CTRRSSRATAGSRAPPKSSRPAWTECSPMSHDISRRRRSRDGVWPLVFLAPLMVGVIVLYFWPVLATLLNSFSSFGPFGDRSFAGLESCRPMLTASFIPRAVLNTAICPAIVLLGIPIAVGIAALMSQKGLRLARFYQVLF